MSELIYNLLKNIPKEHILKTAKDYQKKILADQTLINLKERKEVFTQADLDIQNIILDYFKKSEIKNQYNILAEENLSEKDSLVNSKTQNLVILIDPIDGTNSFCKGEKNWGTMIGVYNRENKKLEHSWNLLCSGEVLYNQDLVKKELSFKNNNRKYDIFDFEGEASNLLPKKILELTNRKLNISTTSYPSAISAGFKLHQNSLNGLAWLITNPKLGKAHFPGYDLIFAGALLDSGWKVEIGKKDNKIKAIFIAKNTEELELLHQSAISISKIAEQLTYSKGLARLI